MWTTCSKNSLSRSKSLAKLVSFCRGAACCAPTVQSLELQTLFAGRVGDRLHAAVVHVAAAVEDHLFDALLLGARRHHLADQLGRRLAGGRAADLLADLGIRRARLGERRAAVVVDHLRIDVAQALVDGQAGPLGTAADPVANPCVGALAALPLRSHLLRDVLGHVFRLYWARPLLAAGLAGLAAQDLAR